MEAKVSALVEGLESAEFAAFKGEQVGNKSCLPADKLYDFNAGSARVVEDDFAIAEHAELFDLVADGLFPEQFALGVVV